MGLDPDPRALAFARSHSLGIAVVRGTATALPFPDRAFDYALAMTRLCFVAHPAQALREMWRVSRRAAMLGLLHRPSLLHLAKDRRSGYRGTLPRHPDDWALDKHHRFRAGGTVAVYVNTYRMHSETRFSPHFDYFGGDGQHRGIFAGCGGSRPFTAGDAGLAVPRTCC